MILKLIKKKFQNLYSSFSYYYKHYKNDMKQSFSLDLTASRRFDRGSRNYLIDARYLILQKDSKYNFYSRKY